jgi:hypothetical protein
MKRNSISQKTRKGSTAKSPNRRKSTIKKEPYISSYQISEGIVKIIIDKIIINSIYEANLNQINNQLNDYYFEYLQGQIEPLFEENFINYTNLKNDENKLFWKTPKPPENQWIEILEPETVENDRYESSEVNIQEIKSKKEIISETNEGIENIENIENNNNTIKKNQTKEKNSRLKTIRQKNKNEEILVNDENKNENNNNDIDNKTKNNQKLVNNMANTIQNNRGKKRIVMVDFPSEDIPGIETEFKHDIYEPSNIHILRKDKEEEIKNKEKEIKLNKDKGNALKKKEEIEKLIKNVKAIDSNKFTFDSNGKIISFKAYKLDNLSKDFTFIKNNIKEKNEKEEVVPIKSKKFARQSVKEQNEEIVIRDNSRMFEHYGNEEKKEKNKEKIIPSGSNFKLILPNIGVVVKENNNKKEGSRDFNKYFKKYSMKDYDKILNEYVPLQNKTKIKTKFQKLAQTFVKKTLSDSMDKRNNNFMNNIQMNLSTINNKKIETMNITNPLLTSTDINQNSENNNTYTNQNSSYIKTSANVSFNKGSGLYNPLMTSSNVKSAKINFSQDKNRNDFSNSIIMKKMGFGSLKLELESLQDLNNESNYRKLSISKKDNIFGRNFIKSNKFKINNTSKDNPLYVFNKKILTDANFGNITLSQKRHTEKENIVTSKHLSKQQAFKELGNTMISGLKIKFPRNRKVELSQ